jgi:hypothetical protein
MSGASVFALGTAATLMSSLAVVAYLRRPLDKILVELCANQARAGFWTAFSTVALGITPIIFAIMCRPSPGPGSPVIFELADVLKWGLIGLMSTVLMLGWVIGKTITRWEKREISAQREMPGPSSALPHS